MEYTPNKEIIAQKVAQFFESGSVVNLGIGLPTLVANYIPKGVDLIFQSENGMLGTGPAPPKEEIDMDLVNAGGAPVSIMPGGCFFDSALSFGIIRGGHVDYTVLGTLEVDTYGSIANYKIPGKMVPGMGGAMDLIVGSKTVIVSTLHFDKNGNSKLVDNCSLPLTAPGQADYIVTDLGIFSIDKGNAFVLEQLFPPYSVEYLLEKSQAKIRVAPNMVRG